MCAIQDECQTRFFAVEPSERSQFAQDLLLHLQKLYNDGHLTAHFLRLAFGELGKSVEMDTGFRGLVEEAAMCLTAREPMQ